MGSKLRTGLGLAALLWLSLLPLTAAPAANPTLPADRAGSQSDLCHLGEIRIIPPAPSMADPVSIVVSGWWGSSCPAAVYQHWRSGYIITFAITVTDIVSTPPVACLDVVTAWAITQEMGTLPPGLYTVQADCSGGACWSFQAKTTFRVWAPTGMYWRYLPLVMRSRFDNSAR